MKETQITAAHKAVAGTLLAALASWGCVYAPRTHSQGDGDNASPVTSANVTATVPLTPKGR